MLSLPTKGGPIKLPNTTVDIRNLFDNLTNIEYEDVPTFQSMVEALDLAKRFYMRGVISQIKLKLHGYKDGPRLMALACQQDPIDRPLARTAFSAFKDDMHLNPDVFRLTSRHGAPDHTNMKTEFLESLTTAGCYAFSQAMSECELSKDVHSRKQYDWTRVSSEFVKELDRLGR
ncbi:hypothetical protein QFC19_004171 [Naganishia cerealis]|uniref:Uncharacterized protein n=1 Tax=Naganishia cerealis TaxID=610337 RepID=A0ACC2VYS4_9TREE|nr:hypothetical protein QFC19_004171 [Naganishia cerealis]